eukprot:14251966-Heterocapsa_arctica.AAC.1
MVEDLQRQLSSFEDLHESQAASPPVLPVFTRNEEVPSSSGNILSLVAKAVAVAMQQHLGKVAAPVVKK